MAGNYASIKLSSLFVGEARREAEMLHRSVGAQVEYWAKLGRALENTPGFSLERVREALEGKLSIATPPAIEDRQAFFTDLSAVFDSPDAATRDYFAALGARDGAVGTDGEGQVVRQPRSGRLSWPA